MGWRLIARPCEVFAKFARRGARLELLGFHRNLRSIPFHSIRRRGYRPVAFAAAGDG
jgi:hypothetical protein